MLIYIYSTGGIPGIHIVLVLVLAAAGAGGVQFMCLSKTERGQTLAALVYIISNLILGFILRNEGEAFPKITIWFLIGILCLFIFVKLVGIIKNESIYSVLSESKTTLRGVFVPGFYLLNSLFLDHSYVDLTPWISSLVLQILVLLFLKFIFKQDDQDPDRTGDPG